MDTAQPTARVTSTPLEKKILHNGPQAHGQRSHAREEQPTAPAGAHTSTEIQGQEPMVSGTPSPSGRARNPSGNTYTEKQSFDTDALAVPRVRQSNRNANEPHVKFDLHFDAIQHAEGSGCPETSRGGQPGLDHFGPHSPVNTHEHVRAMQSRL